MGTIQIKDLFIEELQRPRKIRILLPSDYESALEKRYPVLYMHDGQNMFDPSSYSGHSWEVDTSIDQLEKNGLIDGLIVVGIDCSDRFRYNEYQHYFNKRFLKQAKKESEKTGNPMPVPEAKAYGAFLVHTLKPMIDREYRTMPDCEHTGLVGSSCGGNVSFYLLSEYPHIFGNVGCLSSALSIVSEEIFLRMEQSVLTENTKIYHHMGEKETGNWVADQYCIYLAKKMHKILMRKCSKVKYVIGKDETHNEEYWKHRFPEFVLFAFGKQKRP